MASRGEGLVWWG